MSAVFVTLTDYPTAEEAWEAYPEAAHIEHVDGGWLVFPSLDDYHTWVKQI